MSATIKYNNVETQVNSGKTATLNCKDKMMKTNVEVSYSNAGGSIIYNNITKELLAGQKATFYCEDRLANSNFVITAYAETEIETAGLYDANGDIVATWGMLVNTYGMNVGKTYTYSGYQTDTESPYYVFTKNAELSGGVKLVIPNSVTSIGNYAFAGCTALKSITIPDSVTSIGNMAFQNCSGLNGVYITDLTAWCNIVFGNQESNPVYFAKNLYLNNEIVKNLVIPNTITEIKSYAFAYCSALKSITIPDSVTSIGNMAFWGCTYSTTVTIGNSVQSIGDSAFAYNYQLTTVTINAITPPTLASTCFNGNTKITAIYVPDSAVDTYKGWTNWSAYAGKIKPLSEKV